MRVIYIISLLNTKQQVRDFQGRHKNSFQLIFKPILMLILALENHHV